jgi:biopolymer transport protein ExbD
MQAGDNKSYDDINVTPMVDLYLVLLLIFIIMTTAGVQGVKINLPKATKASEMKGKRMQAVTVDNQGTLKLNAETVSLAALESKLGAEKAKTPELPVIIRGDRQTQYQQIMNVLNICGRLDITQVGLVTQSAK